MRSILSSWVPAGCARRRWLIGTAAALAAMVGLSVATGASAQQQQEQQAPGRVFASEAGMLFNPIKPEATADFEMVMGRLKEALAKSEDPTRQQQAQGWKVFRSVEPGPNGTVLYVMIMDPAVKGADYTVSRILAEAFPTEVQEMYQKFTDAYAGGQSLVNLNLVQDLSQ